MSSSDANTAPTKPPFAVSAAIGSIAGATSKTATAPVERVRLLLQMSSSSTASSSSAGAAVLKQEGATGLWRGNGLAVARAMLPLGSSLLTNGEYAEGARVLRKGRDVHAALGADGQAELGRRIEEALGYAEMLLKMRGLEEAPEALAPVDLEPPPPRARRRKKRRRKGAGNSARGTEL